MAISIDPATKIINVPQSYLTLITGTLYELDTSQFKIDIMSLMDDEAGIVFDDPLIHNTEVTVAGTTFARTIEITNNYSVQFENGSYSVRLDGSNNNIFDVESGVLVQNNVQVIGQNSAGLINAAGAPLNAQQTRDAMELQTTGGRESIDDKLDNNFAIGAAGWTS